MGSTDTLYIRGLDHSTAVRFKTLAVQREMTYPQLLAWMVARADERKDD